MFNWSINTFLYTINKLSKYVTGIEEIHNSVNNNKKYIYKFNYEVLGLNGKLLTILNIIWTSILSYNVKYSYGTTTRIIMSILLLKIVVYTIHHNV